MRAVLDGVVDAGDVDFHGQVDGLSLRWGDLVSPPVSFMTPGPNLHPDFVCMVDPDDASKLRVVPQPTYWADGLWSDRGLSTQLAETSSVGEALDTVAHYAKRASLGPVSAFVFSMIPSDDVRSSRPALSVWLGETVALSDVVSNELVNVPFGVRIRTDGALSFPTGRRYGRSDEVLDNHYSFVVEQIAPNEWLVQSGPMSAGRAVHTRGSGFQSLAEVVNWGHSLWEQSFAGDDLFDPTSARVIPGVPTYCLAGGSPTFRLYCY